MFSNWNSSCRVHVYRWIRELQSIDDVCASQRQNIKEGQTSAYASIRQFGTRLAQLLPYYSAMSWLYRIYCNNTFNKNSVWQSPFITLTQINETRDISTRLCRVYFQNWPNTNSGAFGKSNFTKHNVNKPIADANRSVIAFTCNIKQLWPVALNKSKSRS